ncbi:MAG TPA: GNAT family N-acetyltransferase, partial [Deinococcales bacterium]|nr:GNAT family N-acetyltransferase [Deinococcales bacterium]
ATGRTGRGLGPRLYQAVLDSARQAGFLQAIGGIALPNAASIKLHERLGFEPVGVFRGVGCKFGQMVDVGFWQKPLG